METEKQGPIDQYMHSGSKTILVIEERTEILSAGLRVPKMFLFAER